MSEKKRNERKREMHMRAARTRAHKESKAQKDERKRERNIERRRETPAGAPKRRRSQRSVGEKQAPNKSQNTPIAESSDNFSDKLASMNTELNSLTFRTQNLPSRVNQLDNNINEISTRITNIRNNRYYSQSNLEKMAEGLYENWNTVSPNIKSLSSEQTSAILKRQNDFEAKINQSNSIIDLEKHAYQLSDLSRDVNNIENIIQARLNNYQNEYNLINNELKTTEETISNLSNTSIDWKTNEHPILAIKTHDLTNDKHGILTLTNLRILFEEVKEVVIRKKLFFATEKKTTKEVVLNQPIGSIDKIEKGRVGFFKGAGLFFKFKPQTGLDELKIDTSRNEDEKIIHFYNYIISGEAEKELAPNQEETDHGAPIKCPNCSAPYGEEILKGQTSVKCIYCGTVIML